MQLETIFNNQMHARYAILLDHNNEVLQWMYNERIAVFVDGQHYNCVVPFVIIYKDRIEWLFDSIDSNAAFVAQIYNVEHRTFSESEKYDIRTLAGE